MAEKQTEKRLALIVANYEYQDNTLRQLVAPAQDADSLARVLDDAAIGGFDQVKILTNRLSHEVRREIASFFARGKRHDLLLLYFSGHGVKDNDGQLYLATADTERNLLRATAVPATFVNETMTDSHSRRQVLVLDCCHSGAFARTKADRTMGIKERLGGRGRVVLASSDAVQYSFEDDEIAGEGVRSVFTRVLVEGLETGDADRDRDGYVSLDELYEYVYNHVVDRTPKQRPQMFAAVEGKIIIARNPRWAAKPVELPPELLQAIRSSFEGVRVGAVDELDRLLRGSHPVLALAARAALGRLTDDDSRRVSAAATESLEAYTRVEQEAQTAREGEREEMEPGACELLEQAEEGLRRKKAQKGREAQIDQIGRYQLRGPLDGGAMAVVYRAYDPRFEREVAIKVMAAHLLHTPEFRLRFEREARAIGALQHPAIVPVYDFGEENGRPYLVMAFMPGGTLTSRMSHGPLPLQEIAQLLGQLAPALDMAHQRGIVHRDLKPDNILYDQLGNPYIADFGLAKLLLDTSLGLTGTGMIGTLPYASPEQARGEKTIDGRSDIHSLGVILFEMLTGQHPYDAGDLVGLISGPVPSVVAMRPDLPPGCQAVVERAMAKDREARYATASEMAAELEAVVKGQVVVPEATDEAEEVKSSRTGTGLQRGIVGLIEYAREGFTEIIGAHTHTADDGSRAHRSLYKLESAVESRIWERGDKSIDFCCYLIDSRDPPRLGHQYNHERARALFRNKVEEIKQVLPAPWAAKADEKERFTAVHEGDGMKIRVWCRTYSHGSEVRFALAKSN